MAREIDSENSPLEGSPWPISVALGVTLSEVGILFGIRSISVGGLLLFVVAAAGVLREAGYVTRPERAVGVQGVALVGIGAVLIVIVDLTGSTIRGQSIVIAGAICSLAVPLWLTYARRT